VKIELHPEVEAFFEEVLPARHDVVVSSPGGETLATLQEIVYNLELPEP